MSADITQETTPVDAATRRIPVVTVPVTKEIPVVTPKKATPKRRTYKDLTTGELIGGLSKLVLKKLILLVLLVIFLFMLLMGYWLQNMEDYSHDITPMFGPKEVSEEGRPH